MEHCDGRLHLRHPRQHRALDFELIAVVATFLLGAYLGWHHRTGVVFIAPGVSWLFAWFPLIIAEMIRDGFLRGLFYGLFFVTIGWIVIGGAEFLALMLIALPFRLASGLLHHDATITIENPIKFNQPWVSGPSEPPTQPSS